MQQLADEGNDEEAARRLPKRKAAREGRCHRKFQGDQAGRVVEECLALQNVHEPRGHLDTVGNRRHRDRVSGREH